ncbi:MAG TPA: 2Fe-2S iron-sulfur cluster-binding protein [Pseudolysinimonas sp.]|nr:2Fe-2S iron-sulfur cluster-binding protein [Pseudolysinimonas sp.]
MNDPHIWWYVTRSSAIIAWALMSLSVVWGVLLSTRIFRKVDSPGHLQDLHRYFGSLALLGVAVHMVSLMLDGWLHFTPGQLLIPGHSLYRTIPVALGIIAFYLLVVVYGSSLLRDRLPPRFWKGLHYANYGAVLLIAFHAGLSGTDAGRWWYLAVSVFIISLTAIAIVVRIVMGSQTSSPPPAGGAGSAIVERTPPRIEAPGMAPGVMTMIVGGMAWLADGVRGVRLVPLGGAELPPWHPGSHLTLQLPGGETRQYSLCGDPAERGFYEIAVLRDRQSRGGSAWVHDILKPGMVVSVWEPRSHFPLVHATQYLFVAGGIGITPIRSMIESLPARRDWWLLYLGRSRSTMAYLAELLEQYPQQVLVYARDEHPDRLDVASVVRRLGGEVYCCGPETLIEAVRAAADPAHFHAEHFVPVTRPPMIAGPLEIECSRSGVRLTVPPDRSVLEVLEENRIPMVASCRRGVCGSCETRVLAGVPEHRDSVLDDADKDELGVMFPCVSRGSSSLTLDL